VRDADLEAAIDRVHAAYKRRVRDRSHVFAGYPILQYPGDAWSYQEILGEYPPPAIVQTGVYEGGSLAWFAFLLDLFQLPDSVPVIGVEVDPKPNARGLTAHPRITLLEGNSTDPAIVAAVKSLCPGGAMVSLDSDHSEGHVFRELEAYSPLVPPGSWLIVEDTNQSGPAKAMAKWLESSKSFAVRKDIPRSTLFSFHTWLQRCL
jgi:cephalosporin hydroxylase